jgi:hypothetical protein
LYKKTVILIAVGVCLLAAFVCFTLIRRAESTTAYEGRQPAGTVNGEPFFLEEIDVYGADLRAAVAADYGRRYKLSGVGAKFWDTEYDGVTPRETLTRIAVKNLARNMVLIQEARKRGIDAPAKYHDLEAEREIWNTPSDEIVYGPKQLGPAEYNSYRITGITTELKTALLKKELAPTEAQLRAAYASLPEGVKVAPYVASGSLFKWDGPSPDAEIRAAIHRGRSPEDAVTDLAAAFPGLSREDFDFDSSYISKEDPYQQELAQALEVAVPGDCIPGPERQDEPEQSSDGELYYVKAKQGGGLFAFEDAPGLGRNKWINDQFEIFLDKKVKAARIKRYR